MREIDNIIRNSKELQKEYILQLEEMALSMWWLKKSITGETHCKSYDPLTISLEDSKLIVFSYVFDFHDGGRQHNFNSLKDIEKGLKNELKKILEEWEI